MDVSRRRRTSPSNVVAAGSVWESRLKMDEVKGGFKFFNGEQEEQSTTCQEEGVVIKSDVGLGLGFGLSNQRERRKTWKPEPIEVIGGTPIEAIRNSRSSFFSGIEKNPRSLFPGLDSDEDVFDDEDEDEEKEMEEVGKGSFDVKEVEKPIPIHATVKKLDSEVDILEQRPKKVDLVLERAIPNCVNVKKQGCEVDVLEQKPKRVVKEEKRKTWKPEVLEAIGGTPIQVRKPRSDVYRMFNKSVDGIEKNPMYMKKSRSLFHRNRRLNVDENSFHDDDDGEEEVIEKDSFDVKEVEKPIPIVPNVRKLTPEVDILEQKPKKVVKEDKKLDYIFEKSRPISPIVKKVTPEVDNFEHKPKKVVKEEKKLEKPLLEKSRAISPILKKLTPEVDISEKKPKKVLKEEKKLNHIHEKVIPNSAYLKRQPIPSRKSPPIAIAEDVERFSQTEKQFQSIVDLVMWSDVVKSAFVFGMGTFILISASYAEDFNISLLSTTCYLGLLCLAAMFLYKSVVCRGVKELDDLIEVHLVGEEEASWLLKLILPYFNEFLLKLQGLLSGDPAITMKLAVMLFVVAQYGSSLTMLRIVKLGFFGVFTVPKVCSSYSTHLTTYGSISVQLIQDSWHCCSHKKTVSTVTFALLWCFSSMPTRIWAVFMLLLAMRYYQQTLLMKEEMMKRR